MESVGGAEVRYGSCGGKCVEIAADHHQLGTMMLGGAPSPVSGSSFTALLELPSSRAMELLHSASGEYPPPDFVGNVLNRHRIIHQIPYTRMLNCSPTFPSNTALIERAAKYSVFATGDADTGGGVNGGGGGGRSQNLLDTSSVPSHSNGSALKVKSEPADSNSNRNSISWVSNPTSMSPIEKTGKRRERNMGKGSNKKSKTIAKDNSGDGEKLPYVHVRARRGQATDSHSLAERARREKINARMKLLQELVPGCNKISGTALVLDEIINHVQNLQRQVEYLSMRLAAVDPRVLVAAGNGFLVDCNFQRMMMPLSWPQVQMNDDKQQGQQQWHLESLTQPVWLREEDHRSLTTRDNSLLSYNSGNSASLHSNQLKMES